MSALQIIVDTLLQILPDKVYHFSAPKEADNPYIVWAEENTGAPMMANNKHAELVITGSIRYYTMTEFDTTVDDIQEALDNAGIANRLTQISYNQDTDTIEYWWDWEVPCGSGKIYR